MVGRFLYGLRGTSCPPARAYLRTVLRARPVVAAIALMDAPLLSRTSMDMTSSCLSIRGPARRRLLPLLRVRRRLNVNAPCRGPVGPGPRGEGGANFRHQGDQLFMPTDIRAQDSSARVVYTSDSVHPRHGANFRVFDPLEFIAEVVAHIPDTYEKTSIEYGWYSNRTRGWRKKRGLLLADPPAKDPAVDSDKAPLDQRRA